MNTLMNTLTIKLIELLNGKVDSETLVQVIKLSEQTDEAEAPKTAPVPYFTGSSKGVLKPSLRATLNAIKELAGKGTVVIRNEDLSTITGCSTRSVTRYTAELVRMGYIQVNRLENCDNEYTVLK